MKKLLCLVLCLSAFCIEGVNAQNKGDMFVGGSLGLEISAVSVSGASTSAIGIELTPEYSYFIADNCKLGAELSVGVVAGETVFTVQPKFAYYEKMVDNLYYTPGIKIGGGIYAYNGNTLGLFTMDLDLFAMEFKPTKNIGLSASLVNLNYTLLPGIESNTFDLSILTSPKFGFHYYF